MLKLGNPGGNDIGAPLFDVFKSNFGGFLVSTEVKKCKNYLIVSTVGLSNQGNLKLLYNDGLYNWLRCLKNYSRMLKLGNPGGNDIGASYLMCFKATLEGFWCQRR